MSRVYLSPPDVGDEERRMLLEALDSGWIAPLGPHVDAFDRIGEFRAQKSEFGSQPLIFLPITSLNEP